MHGLTKPEPGEDDIFRSMEDTLGPYYPPAFITDFAADLPAPRPGASALAGEPIELSGKICGLDGEPVCAAILETWQADAQGGYPACGFTRQYVVDGCYVVRTLRPDIAAMEPRAFHITMTLFCDGIARLVTQIFLDGDPRNAGDPLLSSIPEHLRPRLIAGRVPGGGGARYGLDIILRGEGETPFFDDGMNAIAP
jgi:protocatechuate 3,4-dioxygenase alpha subunit